MIHSFDNVPSTLVLSCYSLFQDAAQVYLEGKLAFLEGAVKIVIGAECQEKDPYWL